ncbi:MAG TPA: CBS domain-containing protein [Gemmatimonadales bacterium]|nr:CBS domain-containing protein [Gemmatimonadales bacterium]
MRVAELMRTNLKTVAAEATIADAVCLFADARVSALPVIDRFGRAVGIVTTRNVLEAERRCSDPASRDQLFERTLVLEIMTPWPVTVGPDVDVRDAARQMLYLDVQRLFVERDGALVGVISQTDIVGAVATAGV